MRINSISALNTNPLNFSGEKKNSNSMRKAAHALVLGTALTGVAGCNSLTEDIVHNHYFTIPTDTFTKSELTPTPVPPQIIFIENDLPARTDTVYIPGKTDTVVVEKPVIDTVYVDKPGKTDTVVVEKPGKNDTIYIDRPGKTDTVYVEKPGKNDTIYVKQDPDTVYIDKPAEIVHDTVRIKGDTVYVKDEWTSPVPPKQEEIINDLGIETTGDGKFILAASYFDRKNNVLVQRHLNGQASSRDGKILVYNVIKTGWDHEAEGVTLGKNETFAKELVYLSEDGTELGMKIMKPKVDVKVSNGNEESNWSVFEKGTLSTPDAWADETSFFMTREGGVVDLSNGFSLRKADRNQAVTVTNPYDSEWDLIDWSLIKGDPD